MLSLPPTLKTNYTVATFTDSPQSTADWECFLAWLAAESGLDLLAYKPHQIYQRLAPRRQMADFTTWTDYRRHLQVHPNVLKHLMQNLTISVSSFFRDPELWEILEQNLSSQPGSTPLRAWSAACAGGQELYSLAILLDRSGRLAGSELIGSDCNGQSINQAIRAEYRFTRLDEDLPEGLRGYAQARNSGYVLSERLRSAVSFRQEDLFRQPFSGNWDLIFCRNLLIYLNEQAQTRLVRRLAQALRPGGLLFLGRSERVSLPSRLGLVQIVSCLYRRKELLQAEFPLHSGYQT
ncbi:MAG: protein-glutamate O-methyltransferase CheR [Gemmatimonadaceae bacterium]|nr:protein-glutamate O-methyltransferase CheR [Gloeobacterales cyanobacterium ES-bin-141]